MSFFLPGGSKTLLPTDYVGAENTINSVSKVVAFNHVILNHRQFPG